MEAVWCAKTPKPITNCCRTVIRSMICSFAHAADAVITTSCRRWSTRFIPCQRSLTPSIRRYEHNGHWLEITPSVKLATICDIGHPDLLHLSNFMDETQSGRGHRLREYFYQLAELAGVRQPRDCRQRTTKALREAIEPPGGTRISCKYSHCGEVKNSTVLGLIDCSALHPAHARPRWPVALVRGCISDCA